MRSRTFRGVLVAATLYHATLLVVVAVNSTGWIGRTFPGFFVIPNRIIPSAALPDWADGQSARLFQHQVLAVDGKPVTSAAAVYAEVARRPPGTRLVYTLRAPNGEVVTATVPSRRFGGSDYALLFGAFLLTAAAFLGAGLFVAFLTSRTPASLGLLSAGIATGVFAATGADLYGPYWFVRVHVVAETFVAPAFFHLALVFPRERLGRHRPRTLAVLYATFAVFAAVYEVALGYPSAYTAAHLLATATHGLAGAAIIGVVVYDLLTSRSALVRRRIGVVALGTLGAFLLPAVIMAASAAFGGSVPVNAGAFTAFLFPVSLGYAIATRDLFEIDVMLRRAITYALVVVAVAGLYLLALTLLGLLVPGIATFAHSPLTLAVVNVALLFLIAPLQARVQRTIDRIFFRHRYDTDEAVSDLGQTLASVHTLDEVSARTRAVLTRTVCPSAAALYHWRDGAVLRRIDTGDAFPAEVALPAGLVARAARREVLARYEWDDGTDRPLPPLWQALRADLVVPIVRGAAPIAVLVLGPKASGRPYSAHDVTFLRAAASQIALAMTNVSAFAQLEEWNARLEQQVAERTAALATANSDLGRLVEDLRAAYQQLEEKQASLIRSDRLATLGRLTAGIAHEVNTPLGAVLNTLAGLRRLGDEYTASIDDPGVTPADHHEIARELVRETEAAAGWARKAAAFINRVRVHGREPNPGVATPSPVRAVVAETQALLEHRLRGSACKLEFEEDGDVALIGDASRLGQVLINLVANAIDAYEDQGRLDGGIAIRAWSDGEAVRLTVRDWAGGIPPHVLPRIFEEMFTTKEPGRGTGIGLCIARNLVEEAFGGTLTVEVDPGVGTCFTIAVPAERAIVRSRTASEPTRSSRRCSRG